MKKSSFKSYYKMLPRLFLILTIIFLIWIVILITGPMTLNLSPTWTGVSISFWIIMISVLLGIFIIIDILLYAFPAYDVTELKEFSEIKPKIEMIKGKHVFEFTFPEESRGGIFSKTYIELDNESIIRIRHQMLSAEDIWS